MTRDEHIARRRVSEGHRFGVGDWTLDQAASRLERQGKQVHLEPRLSDLLCHFVRNPGRVHSKEELIDAVWQGRILDDAVVARAVAELRKALGDSAQEPRYIETIPKRGYRLVAAVSRQRPQRKWLVALSAATIVLGLVLAVFALRPGEQGEPIMVASPATLEGTHNGPAFRAFRLATEALDTGGQAANESAVVHLRRALELDPDFALARAVLSEAYSIRATSYGSDGDWAEAALVEASRAVALAADLPESHRALGFALSAVGRFGEAEDTYRRALELRPRDQQILLRLSELLTYRGEWVEAVAVFTSLPSTDSVSSFMHCEAGTLLLGLDYTAEALARFEAALETEPFGVCANVRWALLDLANGELESARLRAERLSSAQVGCCDQLLGEIAWRQGRRADAMSLFESGLARSVEPKSTLMRIRLAQIQGDNSAFRDLVVSLERQLAAGVDVWFQAWMLAVINSELGNHSEALRWHGEAIARGYLDWRSDLAEPAFEPLWGTAAFQSAVSEMRARIQEMQSEIEDRGLLDKLRLGPELSSPAS